MLSSLFHQTVHKVFGSIDLAAGLLADWLTEASGNLGRRRRLRYLP